ncbi:TIGR01212 family radical SAM protein [Candidatus Poribacteria bacterium]|nr:TIGR01212 family radical SAM protein [Candidatus Poribacteria bacterium]
MRGRRYRSFSAYLKEQFGCRVHKVTVDAGFTCPNRDGTLGRGGCVYCDSFGSGSGAHSKGISVSEQVKAGIEWARRRYKAKKFIVYFQAFTNTYAPIDKLKEIYDEGIDHPDVIGISIGTRPDCVPDQVLDLIRSYAERMMVWLELGLQSANVETLRRINRGHGVAEFVDAVLRAKRYRINVCAHVIIGLPREGPEDFEETANLLAALQIEGVKIHSLYIPKDSALARDYLAGHVRLMDREEYVRSVCDFLELLPPHTVIQRLTGETSADRLLAPDWVLDKRRTIEMIEEELERRGSAQGSRCKFL